MNQARLKESKDPKAKTAQQTQMALRGGRGFSTLAKRETRQAKRKKTLKLRLKILATSRFLNLNLWFRDRKVSNENLFSQSRKSILSLRIWRNRVWTLSRRTKVSRGKKAEFQDLCLSLCQTRQKSLAALSTLLTQSRKIFRRKIRYHIQLRGQ